MILWESYYPSDPVLLGVAVFLLALTIYCSIATRSGLIVIGLGVVVCGTIISAQLLGPMPLAPSGQFRQFKTNFRIGAHRGLSDDAPENTILAFEISKQLRADLIEFDISFTKDEVAVLMHDDTVDRTTNGSGQVSQLSYEQVKTLNAAAKFNGTYWGFVPVPTLDEAVKYCLENKLKIIFDIKSYRAELGSTFAALFKEHKELYSTSAISSFDPRVPFAIKKADPNIIVGLTWRPYFMSHEDVFMTKPRYAFWPYRAGARLYETLHIWSLHNWLWKLAGIQLVLAHHSVVDLAYLEKWRNRGVEVVAWTVNDHPQRVFFYKTLKCPFLTDKMTDFQGELETVPHTELLK